MSKEVIQLLDDITNLTVFDSFIVSNNKVNNIVYKNIMCSISGGSDSDIMLDIIQKVDREKKTKWVFFDTGLEYQATKDHLTYLENKYGIEIEVEKAIKPIPICCRTYGQPFLSKQVSEFIQRLQKHDFKWEDKPYETLIEEYPNCKAALKWWCNEWGKSDKGSESKFNIAYNKKLKEFMVANPPTFKISNKCCAYAKKNVAKKYKDNYNIELSLFGVRKAEGGARSSAYKNCFTADANGVDEYRPIFWYKNEDKEYYEKAFNITHSKCYTEYGLTRTGCAGCPFGRDFEKEIEIIKEHEPKLYNAVNKIFKDSYDYMRKYREFKDN